MELVLVIVVVAIVVGFIVLRRRGDSAAEAVSLAQAKPTSTRYHAVSIHYSSDACAAAKALTGQRFLATEAPTLPLPDCDAGRCNCRFSHHADRRARKDRRSPFGAANRGGSSGFYHAEERREDRSRREDDDDLY